MPRTEDFTRVGNSQSSDERTAVVLFTVMRALVSTSRAPQRNLLAQHLAPLTYVEKDTVSHQRFDSSRLVGIDLKDALKAIICVFRSSGINGQAR